MFQYFYVERDKRLRYIVLFVVNTSYFKMTYNFYE